jgi:hypothetical protein
MPISRAAFKISLPESSEISARQTALALDDLGNVAQHTGEAIRSIEASTEDGQRVSKADADGNRWPKEYSRENETRTLPNLPPADAPSAETRDGIGPTQPETKARRSVAIGRDAPQAPSGLPVGESYEAVGGHLSAQTQVIERRLQGQKSAAEEHLTGIHGMLERLMELTETHFFDGGQKMQSLEQRLAQLEMRFSLNRNSG